MNSPISSWVMAIFTRWADPWKDALHWIDSGDPIFRLKSLYKSVLGWAYQHTNEPRSERQIAISPCNSIPQGSAAGLAQGSTTPSRFSAADEPQRSFCVRPQNFHPLDNKFP
jgi:hypothetical protein